MHQFNYEGEMFVGSTRKLISSKKPSLLYQRAVVNSFLTYRELLSSVNYKYLG